MAQSCDVLLVSLKPAWICAAWSVWQHCTQALGLTCSSWKDGGPPAMGVAESRMIEMRVSLPTSV